MTDTQRPVTYVGGPNGGATVSVVGEPKGRVELKGGVYDLDKGGDALRYVWTADAQRADRTPRDGDEASALLAEHGGATPVLEQDVVSSTTISRGTEVQEPEPQAKTVTATEASKARRAPVKS